MAEVNVMNNQQLSIIVQSLKKEELCDYIQDTYHQSMKKLKVNIASGLKPMHVPIANEDLASIKSTFLKYEMIIDSIIAKEQVLLPVVCGEKVKSGEVEQAWVDLHGLYVKEKAVLGKLKGLLQNFTVMCQVYDLIRELTYKSEDRMDLFQNQIEELIR